MIGVHAPVAGRVIAMADVADPVFSGEMMGPGVGIEPEVDVIDVQAPVSGKVVALHSHAFAIAGDAGAILVHLGINTVRLEGEGFNVAVEKGQYVNVHDHVVTWDTTQAVRESLSTTVIVVAMDRPQGSLGSSHVGEAIDAGAELFRL